LLERSAAVNRKHAVITY